MPVWALSRHRKMFSSAPKLHFMSQEDRYLGSDTLEREHTRKVGMLDVMKEIIRTF